MIIPWKMRKKQPKKKAKITFFDSKKKKLIGLYGARTHDISVISTTRCQLRQQTDSDDICLKKLIYIEKSIHFQLCGRFLCIFLFAQSENKIFRDFRIALMHCWSQSPNSKVSSKVIITAFYFDHIKIPITWLPLFLSRFLLVAIVMDSGDIMNNLTALQNMLNPKTEAIHSPVPSYALSHHVDATVLCIHWH